MADPSYALVRLCDSLSSAEFASWSLEWFWTILVDQITKLSSLSGTGLVDLLTMKTVFERECVVTYEEPMMLCQLAVRALLRAPQLPSALVAAAPAVMEQFAALLEWLREPAARTSRWDMHLWMDVFDGVFR